MNERENFERNGKQKMYIMKLYEEKQKKIYINLYITIKRESVMWRINNEKTLKKIHHVEGGEVTLIKNLLMFGIRENFFNSCVAGGLYDTQKLRGLLKHYTFVACV